MAVKDILLLGHPVLRTGCDPIRSFNTRSLHALVGDLKDTLYDFQGRMGFGRGIAAPQIGTTHRVIYIHDDNPLALINPVITRRSRTKMTLWDDCFSFPGLLVKVRRSLSVRVSYQDIAGREHTLQASAGLAELLQHEIDHLNGILAIDRAIDSRHIILRSEFAKWEDDPGVLL